MNDKVEALEKLKRKIETAYWDKMTLTTIYCNMIDCNNHSAGHCSLDFITINEYGSCEGLDVEIKEG